MVVISQDDWSQIVQITKAIQTGNGADAYRLADSRWPELGRGASRITFGINKDYVLKLSLQSGWQNYNEANPAYQKAAYPAIAAVKFIGPWYRWLIVERAEFDREAIYRLLFGPDYIDRVLVGESSPYGVEWDRGIRAMYTGPYKRDKAETMIPTQWGIREGIPVLVDSGVEHYTISSSHGRIRFYFEKGF